MRKQVGKCRSPLYNIRRLCKYKKFARSSFLDQIYYSTSGYRTELNLRHQMIFQCHCNKGRLFTDNNRDILFHPLRSRRTKMVFCECKIGILEAQKVVVCCHFLRIILSIEINFPPQAFVFIINLAHNSGAKMWGLVFVLLLNLRGFLGLSKAHVILNS